MIALSGIRSHLYKDVLDTNCFERSEDPAKSGTQWRLRVFVLRPVPGLATPLPLLGVGCVCHVTTWL